MLIRASSTARVMDLHSVSGKPRVSERRSTAPRTTQNSIGLLRSASISSQPPRGLDSGSWSLLAIGRRKVFMCDMGGFLGEVGGHFEIPAKEPDAFRPPFWTGNEPGWTWFLRPLSPHPGSLTALLASPHGGAQSTQMGDARRIEIDRS